MSSSFHDYSLLEYAGRSQKIGRSPHKSFILLLRKDESETGVSAATQIRLSSNLAGMTWSSCTGRDEQPSQQEHLKKLLKRDVELASPDLVTSAALVYAAQSPHHVRVESALMLPR